MVDVDICAQRMMVEWIGCFSQDDASWILQYFGASTRKLDLPASEARPGNLAHGASDTAERQRKHAFGHGNRLALCVYSGDMEDKRTIGTAASWCNKRAQAK